MIKMFCLLMLLALLTACSTNVAQKQSAEEQQCYMKAIEELRADNLSRINQLKADKDLLRDSVFNFLSDETIRQHLDDLDKTRMDYQKPVFIEDKAE